MIVDGPAPPVELTLDRCIKCNICVTACPVSPVTDLFPGPKYEGPQAGRFRQPDQPNPDESVDYCSGCRICNMVCPTGVKIAEINARARARMVEQGRFPPRTRLRNNLIARPGTLGRLARPVAPLANRLLAWTPARRLAHAALGIHRHAPLPRFSPKGFRRWARRRPTTGGEAGTVAFFHGCSTEYFEPRVGRAAVRVLEALGYRVLVPPQSCCGLPLLSNGEFGAARRYHQANVSRLVGLARQGIPILGTSTSCTLTLKEEAPELLDFHRQEAQLVAAATWDIHEFLLQTGLPRGRLAPVPMRLVYHPPCQYRAHRLGLPGLEVLAAIPGLEVVESEVACCGIAGTYGYKEEKYQVAMEVGRPLFELVASVGGPLAACDSETCRWQITHGTGTPAVHPVELLAASLGLEVEDPLASTLLARSPVSPGG